MAPQSFTRPPGFYDRTPAETLSATTLTSDLQRVMLRFGYQPVETPLVEYADLFLTKSGDDAVTRLFTFEMYGRLLCLRSEFTPSAARLYVERYQHEAKPIRWQFAGPVFRYESPQRHVSRQFTMLGTELIGPSGVAGDAETIGLAANGLFAVGLKHWKLEIGHVGLMAQLLERFDLDRPIRRFVLGHIENLRRPDRGRPYVEEQLEELYAGLPPGLDPALAGQLTNSEDGMSNTLQLLLESADLGSIGAGRTSEDIARRLLAKQRRANRRDDLRQALDFLQALLHIEGTPKEAFTALDRLLPPDADIQATVRGFRTATELLSAYDIDPERITIQMGLARGLNYYTGMVFEAHTEGGQLCGGGRYDELLRVLGAAQDTPSVGFAYGLERILAELAQTADPRSEAAIKAVVVPLDERDDAEAARIAMQLRQTANIELYAPPTRNLSQVLARANKRGTPYVIIVGADERARGEVSVRDMHAGTQFTCPSDQLGARLS